MVSSPAVTSVHATFVDPTRMRVEARTAEGLTVILDSSAEGGAGAAPAPMETLLAALAGCTSMDVASILRKKRQRPSRYEIVLDGTRAGAHPDVFTRIVVEHRVEGAVEVEALRRSIELSATRYCPVNAMLSAAVVIEHRYLLRGEGGRQQSGLVVTTGPGHRLPGAIAPGA